MGDVGRSSDAARAGLTARVKRNLAFSESLLPNENPAEKRAQALLTMSACLGAIGLSRAVSDPDLSQEMLNTVAERLVALLPSADAVKQATGA